MSTGTLTLLHPRRGARGRFSNLEALFRRAGVETLKKFGLYNEQNVSEVLANMFSHQNFGYGKDNPPPVSKVRRSPPSTFGPPGTGDAPAGNASPAEGRRA